MSARIATPTLAKWVRSGSASRLSPCGGNLYAELQGQLIGDACLSPGRILPNHLGDQLTKACRNAWPPWSRLPLPEELEPLTVPADQGFWFDDDQSISQSQNRSQNRYRNSSLNRAVAVRRRGRIDALDRRLTACGERGFRQQVRRDERSGTAESEYSRSSY